MKRRSMAGRTASTLAVAAAVLVAAACLPTHPGYELISVDGEGVPLEQESWAADISADGRYVVFSNGEDPEHPDNFQQVYRKDRLTGELLLISQDASGRPMDGQNRYPTISADGQRVAFMQHRRHVSNTTRRVYVRDVAAGTTAAVSVTAHGQLRDGAYPAISSDGRHVAFVSKASDLIAADTNDAPDAFVRDLDLGYTRRVSTNYRGNQLPQGAGNEVALSGDGRYVVFTTVHNLTFGDTDNDLDAYVHDTQTFETRFASLGGGGTPVAGVSISDDARFVGFSSSEGDGAPHQVWVRDLLQQTVRLISHRHTSGLAPANGDSFGVRVSRDGDHVVFSSKASDLAPGDTNGSWDVFVSSVAGGVVTPASTREPGGPPVGGSSSGGVVANGGRTVAYVTFDSIAPGDTDGDADVVLTRL